MSLLPVGSAESSGYDINNSLRFRSSASAYLSRTPSSNSTSTTTRTFSAWIKRGALSSSTRYSLFYQGVSAGSGQMFVVDFNNDFLRVFYDGAGTYLLTPSAAFRDPSAWYHIVVTSDTTQATSSDRTKIYVNGVLQTITGTQPTQNYTAVNGTTSTHNIGNISSIYFDGYLAEVNFIDGQALTPSSFGSTNATTGVWQPAKYTGTYGTNGFYLPFKDASGTSQNFTLSSEDFSNGTYWNKTSYPCTVTANSTTAPDGTTTADTVAGNNGVLSLIFQSIPTSTSGTGALTASIYAKSGTGSVFTLNVYYDLDTEVNTSFDLSAGTIAAGSGVITSVGNGWYRCSLNIPAKVGAGTSVAYRIWPNTRGGTTNQSIYLWGAQLNTGSTTSPYYRTTTAAQTSINNLGVDYSVTTGGYNNFIPNNISVTAGATYDAMTDSPTLTSPTVGNYCVLNNIALIGTATTNGSTSNANLTATTATTSGSGVGATMAVNMPSGNKWYWEVTLVSGVTGATNACELGVCENSAPDGLSGSYFSYTSSNSPTYTNGDTISFAYDGAASTLYCYKNNSLAKTVTSVSSTKPLIPAIRDNLGGGFIVANFNFGQRPFTYTPPAGYVRLNTFNLPTSTIVKGNKVMDATLYTGNGSTNTITNASSFRPDLVWIKSRSSGAPYHNLYDSVRGVTKQLFSNVTDAEATNANSLTSFNANGFSVGVDTGTGTYGWNTNAVTYVGWQWQAGQGSTSSNTSGTITSTTSVNATAGFSIVTYTGTGANATVGHGLGVAPSMVIAKRRDSSTDSNWQVWHTSLTSASYFLQLNTTAAQTNANSPWSTGTVNSTIFTVEGTNATNNLARSSATYVAYCWAEIAGFSNFGSYTGNGSTDGTFVYTGFRPKFLLIKNSGAAADWRVYDTNRSPINVSDQILITNTTGAETSGVAIDIVSNGFKLRNTSNNGSANTYIYAAFAENPFKNALAR